MSPAGRPQVFPVKKMLGFDRELIAKIDDWRRLQDQVPNFSDSVRALIRLGLAGTAKTRNGAKRKSGGSA